MVLSPKKIWQSVCKQERKVRKYSNFENIWISKGLISCKNLKHPRIQFFPHYGDILRLSMQKLTGDPQSSADIDLMMREADLNKDGKVNWYEFKLMMNKDRLSYDDYWYMQIVFVVVA